MTSTLGPPSAVRRRTRRRSRRRSLRERARLSAQSRCADRWPRSEASLMPGSFDPCCLWALRTPSSSYASSLRLDVDRS